MTETTNFVSMPSVTPTPQLNKNHKITKLSGKGTTHKIREQLNFTDERKWKQFSSRRLELIDRFGLSQRKASEQDDNIKQIATLLRSEFGYSSLYANEFEKLVTAAVQSVRRNRKRSKKKNTLYPFKTYSQDELANLEEVAKNSNSSSGSGSSTYGSDDESNRSDQDTFQTPLPNIKKEASSTLPTPPNTSNITVSVPPEHCNKTVLSPAQSTAMTIKPCQTPLPSVKDALSSIPMSSNIVKPRMAESVTPVSSLPVSNSQESMNTTITNLINYSKQFSIDSKYSSASSSSVSDITADDVPIFLKKKLFNQIHRSRTCLTLVDNNKNLILENNFVNLENLGEMSVKASTSFVLERYFGNLGQSAITNMISITSSTEYYATISSSLFSSIFASSIISKDHQIKLLYLIMGSIVKDFGFDSILYPLNEVIHHILLNYNNKSNEASIKTEKSVKPLTLEPTNNNKLNGLSILSAVSLHASSPETAKQQAANSTLPRASIPLSSTSSLETSSLDSIMNRITKNSKTVSNSPFLTVRKSFENGTLPQPKPLLGNSN
ncbi:Vhr2p NDAI_0E04810 [Naumovozyma dairenensis CBS 421]|uniref:Transcription factor VHR1 n=1 Tax=Naumovozyma dairenensis (strain ATCC 10597 / BCRC 20456 / CBS 421 / NBRC 0211 / NRRL Y-12639) TaxID=1071378 RepID=G0WAM5_NAUDC|nr:hypothetical protein NDAI_0E04810 [Naumovozyma dairenensis CBS 421]CCD25298.1 hypothetical protein NDAI_0E04810 [Naumovozyma dairenensis CBS 421]